ncbi:hypothetical protein BX600DRAFT_516037 [Xylariales sp. PMI_506]|nr:hypothetical protein BX600DRAFT_516037 [Xylariales sp. PMI_506]
MSIRLFNSNSIQICYEPLAHKDPSQVFEENLRVLSSSYLFGNIAKMTIGPGFNIQDLATSEDIAESYGSFLLKMTTLELTLNDDGRGLEPLKRLLSVTTSLAHLAITFATHIPGSHPCSSAGIELMDWLITPPHHEIIGVKPPKLENLSYLTMEGFAFKPSLLRKVFETLRPLTESKLADICLLQETVRTDAEEVPPTLDLVKDHHKEEGEGEDHWNQFFQFMWSPDMQKNLKGHLRLKLRNLSQQSWTGEHVAYLGFKDKKDRKKTSWAARDLVGKTQLTQSLEEAGWEQSDAGSCW